MAKDTKDQLRADQIYFGNPQFSTIVVRPNPVGDPVPELKLGFGLKKVTPADAASLGPIGSVCIDTRIFGKSANGNVMQTSRTVGNTGTVTQVNGSTVESLTGAGKQLRTNVMQLAANPVAGSAVRVYVPAKNASGGQAHDVSYGFVSTLEGAAANSVLIGSGADETMVNMAVRMAYPDNVAKNMMNKLAAGAISQQDVVAQVARKAMRAAKAEDNSSFQSGGLFTVGIQSSTVNPIAGNVSGTGNKIAISMQVHSEVTGNVWMRQNGTTEMKVMNLTGETDYTRMHDASANSNSMVEMPAEAGNVTADLFGVALSSAVVPVKLEGMATMEHAAGPQAWAASSDMQMNQSYAVSVDEQNLTAGLLGRMIPNISIAAAAEAANMIECTVQYLDPVDALSLSGTRPMRVYVVKYTGAEILPDGATDSPAVVIPSSFGALMLSQKLGSDNNPIIFEAMSSASGAVTLQLTYTAGATFRVYVTPSNASLEQGAMEEITFAP